MNRSTESILFADSVAANRRLRSAVRGVLNPSRCWLSAAAIAAGFATAAPLVDAAAFPPVFPLASLFPGAGGDGSAGFVLSGVSVNNYAGDHSGKSVSGAGDVNGDGIDDVIVGAFLAAAPGRNKIGESYVVFGSTQAYRPVFALASLFPDGGGDGSRGFVLTGVDAGDESGRSVSTAGDVNGDGIDDLIIGAYFADRLPIQVVGESYVVFGSTQPFPPVLPLASLYPDGGGDGSRGFVLPGIDNGDFSGRAVSEAGDVNGDGVDDLIIGARGAGTYYNGESYVVFGSRAGFPAVFPLSRLLPDGGGDGSEGFVLEGINEGDESGYALSAAGDVNGDGTDDLIIGAFGADPGGHVHAGESYVVFGSTERFVPVFPLASLYPAGGGDGTHGFVLTGIDRENHSGGSVGAAGDVNGDGTDDLIIGGPLASPNGRHYAGESYVVFGSTSGFPPVLPLASLYAGTRGFVLTGIDEEDISGASVSAAGDVNGDGIDDVIIGADGADPGGHLDAGESYVVFGSTQGFPPVLPLASLYAGRGGDGSAGFVLVGIDSKDRSGGSVSAAGDVNGDGVDDLIIGAELATPGGRRYAGESYLVFGRAAVR